MVVKLRLLRRGRCGLPVFWVVVATSTVKRDGRFLSKVGIYNPLNSKDDKLSITNKESLEFYLANGAEPTDTVLRLLKNYYANSEEEVIKKNLGRYMTRKDRWEKSVSA